MRYFPRLSSLIDLVSEVLDSKEVPCDRVAFNFFKSRRFIGSKDRQFISNRLYQILHKIIIFKKLVPTVTPRTMVFLNETLFEGFNDFSFKQELYGPAPLTNYEINLIEQSVSCYKTLDEPTKLGVYPFVFESLQKTFKNNTKNILDELLKEAPIDIRVNTLKISRDEILKKLEKFEAKKTELSPFGVRLPRRIPFQNDFKEGEIEFQDEGSQLVSLLCDVRDSFNVLDLCAGAGGKTLAIASLMNNKGQIFATDINSFRLQKAKTRLNKAGVNNVQIHHVDWLNSCNLLFDRVLVDAPCSGIGTFRRHPDGRTSLTRENLEELVEKQKNLIKLGASFVKPGGRLIYATCSLLPEENIEQINNFKDERFELLDIRDIWRSVIGDEKYNFDSKTLQLDPYNHKTDGFFIAVLEKRRLLFK